MAKKKKRRTTKKWYNTKKRQPTEWLVVLLGVLFALGVGLVYIQYTGAQTQERLANEAKQEELAKVKKKKEFINQLAPYAQELQQKYHVLSSVTLAQAILESDWGKSSLAADYHNYFGIKGDDPDNTKEMTTKEYLNGQWVTTTARFRVYRDYRESMLDHVLLFAHGTSWDHNHYQHVVAATNYTQAAQALKQDGYATDPNYPEKLIELVKTYRLDQFDW